MEEEEEEEEEERDWRLKKAGDGSTLTSLVGVSGTEGSIEVIMSNS